MPGYLKLYFILIKNCVVTESLQTSAEYEWSAQNMTKMD